MRRSLPTAICALIATTALAGGAAAAEAATVVGIGDNNASAFSDARLRALALTDARLTVPYDAATSEPQRVSNWLAAVAAAGMRPHIAFEHVRNSRCPSSPCSAPTRAAYAVAVRAFIARFPQVRVYTTWNEANHVSQPVSQQPEVVAGYYEELRAACPSCTVVAGDVLDSGSYVRWLQRFKAATTSNPKLWGLHNYADVTYGETDGTDSVLAAVEGELWLEETGGIVTLRDSLGRQSLRYDETRAAQSVERAFTMLPSRPRITRVYIYNWLSTLTGPFDSGLIRPDGSLRPSYDAVVKGLAALRAGAKPATKKATVTSTVRWTASWSKARGNILLVKVRCIAGGGRCRGRVAVSVSTRRKTGAIAKVSKVSSRAYRTYGSRRSQTLRVKVGRKVRSRLRVAKTRRLSLRVVPVSPAASAATVTLKLAKPR